MNDTEQLLLMEPPPPPLAAPETLLDRHRAHVRVVPAWSGPGWVIAWKVPKALVKRPYPLNYHREGHPPKADAKAGTGPWWHEEPVPRLADALARIEQLDGDWRNAGLPGVYLTMKEARADRRYGR